MYHRDTNQADMAVKENTQNAFYFKVETMPIFTVFAKNTQNQ